MLASKFDLNLITYPLLVVVSVFEARKGIKQEATGRWDHPLILIVSKTKDLGARDGLIINTTTDREYASPTRN